MNVVARQTAYSGTDTLTHTRLRNDNRRYRGTGGISANNCAQGFRPAFLDTATGRVYPSRFANGSPAPMHLLDGLPNEVVLRRDAEGMIVEIKVTVIAGFVRGLRFYTRDQAATTMAGV